VVQENDGMRKTFPSKGGGQKCQSNDQGKVKWDSIETKVGASWKRGGKVGTVTRLMGRANLKGSFKRKRSEWGEAGRGGGGKYKKKILDSGGGKGVLGVKVNVTQGVGGPL